MRLSLSPPGQVDGLAATGSGGCTAEQLPVPAVPAARLVWAASSRPVPSVAAFFAGPPSPAGAPAALLQNAGQLSAIQPPVVGLRPPHRSAHGTLARRSAHTARPPFLVGSFVRFCRRLVL